jgi:hypothetical protein
MADNENTPNNARGPRAVMTGVQLATATDEELARLKTMTDDELLRCAQTLDLFSVVESSRRLREALHKEERAIKWLTGVLVFLTVILIAFCRKAGLAASYG